MPALDHDRCYAALTARDRRFDGRFWVGVRTTGVYCRPVCPSRTPSAGNVDFYAHPAAAEDAGLRPCKRCQPDAVPGTPAWDETGALVERALVLIDGGALDDHSVEDLARRLAVSDRHLRRVFAERLGTTPDAVARSRRAHLARRLLVDTDLRIADVVFAAGFGSVRQGNDVLRSTFGATPTELRRRHQHRAAPMPAALGPARTSAGNGTGPRAAAVAASTAPSPGTRSPGAPSPGAPPPGAGAGLSLRLPARTPFAGAEVVAWFAARALPGLEWVDDGVYHRRVHLPSVDEPALVTVRPGVDHVRLGIEAPPTTQLAAVVAAVSRVFDLDANPEVVNAALAADPVLGPLVAAHPGRRVPGAWDGLEMAVRAIVGQQISVAAARTIVGRIVDGLGDGAFPTAEVLATAETEHFGVIGQRAASIRAVSAAVLTGEVAFDGSLDGETLTERLVAIRGIGPWTASTIALRTGEPDAFPAGDLHLRRVLGIDRERDVVARAAAWRPWRSYAAIHLFHQPMPAPSA